MNTMRLRTYLAASVTLVAAIVTPTSVRAQGGFAGPGRYEITNVNSGKVLDLDRNDRTTVIQFSARNKDNQQWDAHPADEGYWVLRNVMTGAALQCMGTENGTPVRGMPFTQSPSQQWQIRTGRDGNALITSRLGKTLDIAGGSRGDGARVQTFELIGRANQRFTFRRIVVVTHNPPNRDRDLERDRERDRRRAEAHSGRFDERDSMWKLDGDGACFYRGPGFTGQALCVRAGEDMERVPQDWLEVFRSIKFFGRARAVVVFRDPDFQGRRVRIEHDEPDLELFRSERGETFERHVLSFRVFGESGERR